MNTDEEVDGSVKLYKLGGELSCPAHISNSPPRLTLCHGSSVYIFSADDMKLKGVISKPGEKLICIAELPELETLVLASSNSISFLNTVSLSIVKSMKVDTLIHKLFTTSAPDAFIVVHSEKRNDGELLPDAKVSIMFLNKCKASFKHCMNISHDTKNLVEYCRELDVVASISNQKLVVVSGENRNRTKFARHNAAVSCLTLQSDGSLCATGCIDGAIYTWDLGGQSKSYLAKLHWHYCPVISLHFSPDRSRLYSGGHEGTLVCWDLDSHRKMFVPRFGTPIKHISSSDEAVVLVHANNEVSLVRHSDLVLMKKCTHFKISDNLELGIKYHKESQCMLMGGSFGQVAFYSLPQNDFVNVLEVIDQNFVSGVDKSEIQSQYRLTHLLVSGRWLYTVEQSYNTGFSRLKCHKFVSPFGADLVFTCESPHSKRLNAMTCLPRDPKLDILVTCGDDCLINLWHPRTNESPEGEDAKSHIWECVSRHGYQQLTPKFVEFCPDGSILSSIFGDFVVLWDFQSMVIRFVIPFSDPTNILFGQSLGSSYMATTSNEYVMVYNLNTLMPLWCKQISITRSLVDQNRQNLCIFGKTEGLSTDLSIFNWNDQNPVKVITNIIPRNQELISAAFGESYNDGESQLSSTLYYVSNAQDIYLINGKLPDTGTTPVVDVDVLEGCVKSGETLREDKSVSNKPKDELPLLSLDTLKMEFQFHEQIGSTPSHLLPPPDVLLTNYLNIIMPMSCHRHEQTKDSLNSDEAWRNLHTLSQRTVVKSDSTEPVPDNLKFTDISALVFDFGSL